MLKYSNGKIAIIIPIFVLLASGTWYAVNPTKIKADIHNIYTNKINSDTVPDVIYNEITIPNNEIEAEEVSTSTIREIQKHDGDYVLVNLGTKTLELRNATNTLLKVPLAAYGKTGSYYETIGGEYLNDYKERLHFSSIGHVYMPFSIHVFGNYFIHGIPYYEDGTRVSSEYSGGCVRLADNDAESVYNFISRGTPIIITKGTESDFTATKTASTTISSKDMTRLMVAAISLELLKQDTDILDADGVSTTTRRKYLKKLFAEENPDTSVLYANTVSKRTFVKAMNSKAVSIGLSNTVFVDLDTPVETTAEDNERFMNYISTYKSYLLQFVNK